METQVKILGWLYIILAILGIVGGACLAAILVGAGLISGDEVAIPVTTILALIFGFLAFIFSIPEFIAGVGLLKYRNWARILAIILGGFKVLNITAFPISTAVGIYTLVVLLSDESSTLFVQ